MDNLHYTAVFEPASEGGYSVTVPALPGCISEGDSMEEARNNISEAMHLYLETYLESHSAPPIEKALPVISNIEIRVGAR